MKKRITALLLCLVMVFSLIPTSVWASELPVEPTKTPTFSDVKVQVKCSADSANHPTRTYDLSNENFRSSASNLWDHPDYGTWHYTIVLNRAELIKQFDKDTGKIHTDTTPNADTRITLNWDSDKEEWVQSSSEPVVIECGCKGEEIDPNAPTTDDLKGLVTVKCINPKVSNGTNCLDCQYGLRGGNSVGKFVKVSDTKYTVTIGAEGFLPAFQKRTGHEHDLYSAKTLTWVLTYEEGKWVANPETLGVDDTILVTHIPEATYDVLKGMEGGINTRCVNKTSAYTNYGVIAGLVGESAASAQVVKNADGAYILTVSTKNFADAASKHNDRVHDLLTGETANFVLSLSKNDADKYVWTATPVTEPDGICEVAHRVKVTFDQNYTNAPAATEAMYKYNTAEVMEGAFPADPSRSGYVFQGWNTKADGTGDAFIEATAVTEDVTVYAQWGQLHPVKLVIYRNGDISKAYKTVSLDPQLKGTPIDLTQLKISDYYTGNYKFYGWYNDGKWNEYLKNPDNAPAGLEKITVNGWTNLKCMVYDYETVVYFETEEALKAYQADHSKTEGIMKTTTALHGSTLPTVDAPDTNNRAGYTFQHWSREGQSVDVAGQTVNGWTNLYAAWTPNTDTPYKVEHYKQKLDGTYVKADTDELTGTTDTRATAVAKSYTGFTVDKTVEGTVESGIIAGDGSLVLKLYYTRNSYIISSDLRINGGDANLADGKTYAWTHRYGGKFEETIDYQPMLDALKARAMKVDAANEPYDAEIKLCFPKSEELFNEKILTYGQDGAFWNPGVKNTAYIWGHATTSYEVIFNTGDGSKVDTQIVKYGELATEPTTELKGYDFLGWFDADGNPFDFNNTEITHKTTLTAKWEKKTYIIASDLRINGGDANLADGKTYPWSYRYGGKFEETIDYTEMFDALKTRAMKVDEANGPVDSVVTLCFPGDYPATAKKLFNDTILTYGQDGGGWNPGNKNTAPIWGFATNVYAVTFNYKDDKTATATQNVEYGNMATEPQKVDRPGYRFLGWFTEDGKAFDFSTPITKSMTLTAKWEIVNINAYIIPITSDGTQLVGAGFDMALNTTTLGRVGLPGYEDEDAVRIHFATFASSAGLADAGDYFPGTDPLVVKAVADLKNGLERRFAAGVNEAKADGIMSKTNWTYLHVGELDDEDDTNFLSGNLVFYSARFVTEDSEHVTGMPNAEYTHNAVAVYDYYLDGETITIPDAVPERYGYDFLGWSVKAVPAENDKLLKAGDTVTVDGDVVFTAQWKLKEYTVSFDSKGGTKVDSQIVEHGSTATKPRNPHRNDYTFKGWYLDGKKFDFSTPITGDITLVARWATKTSGGSNSSSDTTTKDNGKTVQSGKTFDGGIALYVGLSVLSATGSALVITKKKRG